MTARLRCPVHDMPDCSPLLNGCAWVTSPDRHIKAHEDAKVSIERDGSGNPRMKIVTCTARGCVWGARTGKSRKLVIEAHQRHMVAVSVFAKRVEEEAVDAT